MSLLRCDPLADAILRAIIYADLFDYAMTVGQIHDYLIGYAATRQEVKAALDDQTRLDGKVAWEQEFLTLPGREYLAAVRRTRYAVAASLWHKGKRYARILAYLPFVRMIAVTGALAVDNPRESDDIDFFIIVASGRLWTVRGLVILLVRLARRFGDQLCPNYLISENALYSDEQNLYTAHEVIQAVPLYGMAMYRRYRVVNDWVAKFLPNAYQVEPAAVEQPLSPFGRRVKALGEKLLSTRLGARLERWEQTRKIAKLRVQLSSGGDWSNFTADCCKGHFHGHARRALTEFENRWEHIQA